uniref:Uncharacterized protein n=1 Tax=Octopus bimaculoides TaxID=37653 RepID=A0A0L8I6X9_OCTBM
MSRVSFVALPVSVCMTNNSVCVEGLASCACVHLQMLCTEACVCVCAGLSLFKFCKLEVVDSFRYLGDQVSSGGGCAESVAARIRIAWAKFRELLPLLATKGLSLRVKGRLYDACVRTTMLHGSETWAVTAEDIHQRKNPRSNDVSVSIVLVLLSGREGWSYHKITEEFNLRLPYWQPIYFTAVRKLIKMFKETGSVLDKPRSG